jgi:ubiquinone/menaquinone biosynthesis C-methylase UbiE
MIVREGRRVFNPAWAGALEWGRDDWQNPEAVLRALALPEDAVVADIGAGGGYFTERLSRAIPSGHVFASDVQDGMIERLNERVRDSGLANVTVVHARFDDPGLPDECCDLVFLSSVYKEIEGRVAYLRRVRPLLRPGGRVAILEFPAHRFPVGFVRCRSYRTSKRSLKRLSAGPPFISPKAHSLSRHASALSPRVPTYRVIPQLENAYPPLHPDDAHGLGL